MPRKHSYFDNKEVAPAAFCDEFGCRMVGMKREKSLSILYCLQQAFYYALFCAAISFCSVYLLGKGFSNSSIGMVIAIGNVISVLLQPFLSSYSDSHPSVPLSRIVSLLMGTIILLILSLFVISGGTWVLAAMAVIIGLTMTLMPLINSLAFVYKGEGISINYGIGRGSGSISYAIISFALGQLVSAFSSDILPVASLLMALFLGLAVVFYQKPNVKREETRVIEKKENAISMRQFIKEYKLFTVFLVGVTLVYLDHSFINNFFIQIIRNVGGNESSMGVAVAFASALEIPTMFLYEQFERKFGAKKLFLISILGFAVKHVLTWYATNLVVLFVAQFFQMFGFALFASSGVYLTNRLIASKDRVKGQSMFTMAQTIATVIAAVIGGVMLDAYGVKIALFTTMVLTLIGVVIVFITLNGLEAKEE